MTAFAEGTVIRGDAKVVHVLVDGDVRQFAPRGKLFKDRGAAEKNPIAVGDRVRVSLDGDPPGVEEVLSRRNYLSRVASSHDPREQVLFANVDQLFIVGSLAQPRFSSNRTDRILAACEYYEIPVRLILNKTDLVSEEDAEGIAATYAAAGLEILRTCATEQQGIDELARLLNGHVSVMYGASGAGKSTLLNAIQPELKLRTAKISKYWSTGKHTTTFSQMHHMPAVDAWIIDTPGIRAFRPYGINKAELRDCFPEFAPVQESCRFPDCSHDHEPECAVFDAVEEGRIAPTRYASYVEILDELAPPPEDVETVLPPEG